MMRSVIALGRAAASGVARAFVFLPILAAAAVLLRRDQPHGGPDWQRGLRLWQRADLDLTVVVPFYNPGESLRPTVTRLVGALRAERLAFEVVAVSDGSTDGSEHLLDGLGTEVRALVSPRNEGKGAALHRGFAEARGRHIGFVDADGDIDPEHLIRYLRTAQSGGHDVVYGDKWHAGSRNASSRARRLVSTTFSTMVLVLFGLSVRDTQTGCKLFRRDALARLLPFLRERGFAFDLELFVVAKAAGITRLQAAPVRLNERLAGSTVTLRAVRRTVGGMVRVYGRLKLRAAYPRPTVPALVPAAQLPALPPERVSRYPRVEVA
jgi:glycosyltransferase involved in cell wall biosynthesis